MGLIDFELDGYDYLTFVILLAVVIAFFYAMVTLGGLPGKLAARRNHPHAESVKLGGWIGLFTVFPWIHALIWAYHDSLTVDVRKLPPGEGNLRSATGAHGVEEEADPEPVPATLSEVEAEDVPPANPRKGSSA